MADHHTPDEKVALITGAAHRVGAACARHLHAAGLRVIIHYRHSGAAAEALARSLNAARPASAGSIQADLLDYENLPRLIEATTAIWGRLDALINNASGFYPTPLDTATLAQWDDLLGSNLKAPFFLAQAAAPELTRRAGCIINIADIHAERPLKGYPVYSIAKAGLVMLTKSLARELGPAVRVNAIAPGAILWPEHELSDTAKAQIIERTALKRHGDPFDVARAALFLIRDADYMTGHVLTVDGGRSLSH